MGDWCTTKVCRALVPWLKPSCHPAALPLPRAQKAGALRRAVEMEEAREAATLEARRWQHQAEELEAQVQLLEAAQASRPPPPPAPAPVAASLPAGTPAVGGGGEPDSAVQQLAALQEQLECLAEGGLPALQQERARMSICLQTIKVGLGRGCPGGWVRLVGFCWPILRGWPSRPASVGIIRQQPRPDMPITTTAHPPAGDHGPGAAQRIRHAFLRLGGAGRGAGAAAAARCRCSSRGAGARSGARAGARGGGARGPLRHRDGGREQARRGAGAGAAGWPGSLVCWLRAELLRLPHPRPQP